MVRLNRIKQQVVCVARENVSATNIIQLGVRNKQYPCRNKRMYRNTQMNSCVCLRVKSLDMGSRKAGIFLRR